MVFTERRPYSSTYSQASRWVLGVAVAGSALAIGTVHTLTLCIVTAALAIAAVAAWWRAEPLNVRPAATLLLFTGIALVSFTALQCVPMPIAWLAVIAPHNADVWSRALSPLHEGGPRWAPITIDPVASRIELLKGVAYLLAFVTAIRVAHRREGVTFLSAVIVLTGVVLATTALLHPAFGARKVFGLYEPRWGIADVHIAPILNPNSLAGYLNIAFCITLAASLAREPRVPRSITGTLALLLGATQVWIASRGGVIAMTLGAAVVSVLALSERVRRRDPRVWLTLGSGAAILIGGTLIILASSQGAQSQLFEKDLSKFAVLPDAFRMLSVYGIFGTGRGAFESAFPQFRTGVGYLTVTHPENIVAQWLTEWGVPIGGAGLVATAIALRPTAALARSRTAAGAWAALVAIAAQNMADLGSEIPGVMVSVVLCGSIVVAGSAGLHPKWGFERWSRSSALVVRVAAATSVLAIAGGITALGHHVSEDRRTMHDAAVAHVAALDRMHQLARAAMLRHPAEPYLPFITALRASRVRDENPVPWLGAVLERARVYGPAHLLLAHVVAPRSASQARLEYRLAMEQAPEMWGVVTQEAPRLVESFDDAMELVSPGEAGGGMLHSLVLALTERLPATCVRLDAEMSARNPNALGPVKRAAQYALMDLDSSEVAPWCDGAAHDSCVEHALSLAQRVQHLEPGTCYGYRLEARVLSGEGAAAARAVMDRLARIADKVTDRVDCLRALADIARATHDDPRFDLALTEIAHAGCDTEKECMDNLTWVAQTYEASGNPRRALAIYKRAYDRNHENDSLLESVARLAGVAGLNAEALRDYQELGRRHPEDGRWRRAAEEQREAMLRGSPQL